MSRHVLLKGVAAGVMVLLSVAAAEPPASSVSWESLRAAWAAEHLEFASDLLREGEVGFADTQAGLARQLLGEDAPALAEYRGTRGRVRNTNRGWNGRNASEYATERSRMHGAHAVQAAGLLTSGTPPEVAREIEAWALRYNPDCGPVRARRGETRVEEIGCWLPGEVAAEVARKHVRRRDETWGDPAQGGTWEDTWEIPLEHFSLRSNLPRDRAIPYARDVEALFLLWQEILEGIGPMDLRTMRRPEAPPVPTLWVLRSYDDFLAAAQGLTRSDLSTANVAGYANPLGLALFSDVPSPRNAVPVRATFFHEVTHLIHFCQTGWRSSDAGQMWCIEGIADLMKGFHVRGEVTWEAMTDYRCGYSEVTDAQWKAPIPPALIDLERVAYQGPSMRLYYAQSLGLAHYLMFAEGGRHREPFLRYLLAVCPGDAVPATYDEHFPGLSREDLCRKARPYLDGLGR